MTKRRLAIVSYLVPLALAMSPVCFAQPAIEKPENKEAAESTDLSWEKQAAEIEKLLNEKYDGTINTSAKPARLYLCLLVNGAVQWQYIWNTCGVPEIDETLKQCASSVEHFPSNKKQWWGLAVLQPQSKTIKVMQVPKTDWNAYMMALQAEIKQNWHPPAEKHTEAALAKFKINEKAEVTGFVFEKPTNDPEFDKAAKAAVANLTPLPFPAGAQDQVDIEFSFTYNVKPRASLPSPKIVVPTTDDLIAQAIKLDNGHESADAQTMKLNNEAFKEITNKQFDSAISKLQTAILADCRYKLAQNNLAIAYTNLGLEKKEDYSKALSLFHRAFFYDPGAKVHLTNISYIITCMKKSSTSFDDRKALAIEAEAKGDLVSALVEYSAALAIKSDGDVFFRRGDVYAKLGSKNLARAQYQLAKNAGDERADEKITSLAAAKKSK